jgi:glycosyltransferase involved in cell wall biosynthesis
VRLTFIANPNSVHTERWLGYFAGRGHSVDLIAYARPGRPLPPDVTVHDLTSRTNVPKLRFAAWALAVRRLVRRLRPDVLHAHQAVAAGWLGAAAGYHPFVVSAWGSDLLLAPRRSRLQRALARWTLRRADHVSCVSEGLAHAARALGADPARVEVAPLGVDRDVFYPAAGPDETAALKARFGLGAGPAVLSLRAMRPIYHPLDIAAALPRVLAQVPDARFAIRTYGADEALLGQFRALVAQGGAANAVTYVGEQAGDREVAALNRAADVAVSVPASDGTPVSVLEAMACGAVPVLSDLPSLREWVSDGREALLVPVGDPEAIVAAVVRLLRDEPLRRDMRARALELIAQRADARVWMAHAEELYETLRHGA